MAKRQTNRHGVRQTEGQTDRGTDRQQEGKTKRERDSGTDRAIVEVTALD